jgi:hypothetical protein
MASKRSYETYMDVATAYKHAIAHLESLHESLSEEWIEEPGNITSNEHHPKRRMTKRESSYDTSHLQEDLAGFTATYDQQEASRDTRKVEQEAHEDMGVSCSSSWEEQLQHWITQYEKKLQTPSETSKDKGEQQAGIWQNTQRTAYKQGTLSYHRVKQLVASPGWEWRTQREIRYKWEEQLRHWITQYEKLQRKPSTISKDVEETRAGRWQDAQRTAYRRGALSEERIRKLVENSGWEWGTQREISYTWEEQRQNWITQYEKLQKNPCKESEEKEERRGGVWQMYMRSIYKKGTLSETRVAALETIPGWTWSGR